MRIIALCMLVLLAASRHVEAQARAGNGAHSQLESSVHVYFSDVSRAASSGTNSLTYTGDGRALHGGRGGTVPCDYANRPDGVSLAQSISRYSTWTGPNCDSDDPYQLPTGFTESGTQGASCTELVDVGGASFCPEGMTVENNTVLDLETGSGKDLECPCDFYFADSASGNEFSHQLASLIVGPAPAGGTGDVIFDIHGDVITTAHAYQVNYICPDLTDITCIGTPLPVSVNTSLVIKVSVFAQKVGSGGTVSKGKLLSSSTYSGGCLASSGSTTISPLGIFNNVDAVPEDPAYDYTTTCPPDDPDGFQTGFVRGVGWVFLYNKHLTVRTTSACIVEVEVTHDMN